MRTDIRPATWDSFCEVMGDNGGCGGCWCMLWRRTNKDMQAHMGAGNRDAMKSLFEAGHVPGLVAFQDGQAVGWIQIDQRHVFCRLETSRILKPVDAQEVWSVSCFMVHKTARRRGLSVQLLEAACDFAASRGARIVEGYPVEPDKPSYPAVYAWTGFASTFRAAGFTEVARRSEKRPVMRRILAQT